MVKLRIPLVVALQDKLIDRPFHHIVIAWLGLYALVGIIFALIYGLGSADVTKGTSHADWDDALSFSFVTQATLGYGDYTPAGWMRLFANLQAIIGTGLNGAAIGLITFRILRRPQPIRVPDRISFCEVAPGSFSFWLRFISTDTNDLIDVTANLTFVADGTRSNDRYDTVGGEVHEMPFPTVTPFITIAMYADASVSPVEIHAPASPGMDNNSRIPIHPSMFLVNGAVDPTARLIFRVRGYQRTGELFSFSKEYFADEIVCARFETVNNNLLHGASSEMRQRAAEAVFDAFKEAPAVRCGACASLPICPFTKPQQPEAAAFPRTLPR